MDGIRLNMASPAEAFTQFLAVLDRMEIPYLVGGSVASSIHGISRPTMDADVVADLQEDQIEELTGALGSAFYADPATMRQALRMGRAFNLIHFATTFKIDVFPLRKDSYSQVSFARRHFEASRSFGPVPIECAVATAEDTILRKLEWYRSGGGTSERQWNDVRGVLRINRDRLDYDYLQKWAMELRIDDLLAQLLAEPER